jgi:hypothetical protein
MEILFWVFLWFVCGIVVFALEVLKAKYLFKEDGITKKDIRRVMVLCLLLGPLAFLAFIFFIIYDALHQFEFGISQKIADWIYKQ